MPYGRSENGSKMNYNEAHELLIDFAEGTLPAERRAEVEEMVKRTPQLQKELEIIRSAFAGLHTVPVDIVPEHYFTNFIPRLRQRIGSGEIQTTWNIPHLVQSLMAPAAVVAIIVSLISVYRSFEPEEIRSPVYPLVNQLEQNDLNAIMEGRSDFEPVVGIVNGTGAGVVINAADIDVVNLNLNEELLSDDHSPFQSESELVGHMDDHEIEQLLERMTKPAML